MRDLQPIVNAGRTLAAAMLARSDELELLLRLDQSLAAATSAIDVVRIATARAREILRSDVAEKRTI